MAKRLDKAPSLVTAVRMGRELLPGDSQFGDPLSTAGQEGPHVVGRRITALTEKHPGALREVGLSALQVWQELSEAQGRGRGDKQVAILFTDLVDFSEWALDAGDTGSLELLRDVGRAVEPPISDAGGKVVKRLGDGMMAVFPDAQAALDATFEACGRLAEVEAEGYDPRLRAGIHVGRPRKIGSDYLGVDVNIAARVADSAEGGEVLLTSTALEAVTAESLRVEEKRMPAGKGTPKDLRTFAVTRA